MSFLYNKEFLNKIQGFGEGIVKRAQGVANPGSILIAKGLSDVLYKELNNLSPSINVASETPMNIDVSTLKNFGTFLNSLTTHGVVVNGERLVYAGDEMTAEQAAAKGLGTIDSFFKRESVEGDRNFESKTFYVNGKMLRSYLESLKEFASTKEQPAILKPYINTLILNFNRYFQTIQLDEIKKKIEPTGEDLSPDTIVDDVPNYIFYPEKPLAGVNPLLTGQYPIKLSNLSSAGSFNDWAMRSAVLNIDGSKSFKRLSQFPEEIQENKCILLNILLARASYYKNALPEKKLPIANQYYKFVQKLMSQNNCPATSAIPGTETPGAETPGTKVPGGISSELVDALRGLITLDLLPLSISEIDLDRIEYFVNTYKDYLSKYDPARITQVQAQSNLLARNRNVIDRMMKSGRFPSAGINLQSSPASFTSLMNHVADFRNLIGYLDSSILIAGNSVRHMLKYYGKALNEYQKNLLKAQYGSILTANKNKLYQWTHLFKQRELPR